MLVCRCRPRLLSSLGIHARSSSTSQSKDSIFTAPESPWDHVFSDVEPAPSAAAQRLRSRFDDNAAPSTPVPGRPGPPSSPHGLVRRSSAIKPRRASLTAQEMSVFDEMFDMIFNAVSTQDHKTTRPSPPSPASPSLAPSIGRTGAPMGDVFKTLRRRSRVRWTTAIDEELDRKKETMELFNTDYALLQWVTDEVFGPGSTEDAGRSIYPHLIAHAMRLFRTTYRNPSLSLAVFEQAARASIESYVFGCTAPAYNELIEARWEGWGDLEGVYGALEEMRANGVKIDGRTRVVAERVRLEVGAGRSGEGTARGAWVELGEEEVMRLLHRIERLAVRDRPKRAARAHEETWKTAGDDGWEFDGWKK